MVLDVQEVAPKTLSVLSMLMLGWRGTTYGCTIMTTLRIVTLYMALQLRLMLSTRMSRHALVARHI
jgi:hypothetical protein